MERRSYPSTCGPARLATKPLAWAASWPAEWQHCLADYLQHLHDLSGSVRTPASYAGILRSFYATGLHPESVSVQDVLTFIHKANWGARARGKEPSIASQNRRRDVISSWYRWASQYTITVDGKPAPLYSGTNPAANIKPGRAPRTGRALSEDELRRLLSAIDRNTTTGKLHYAILITLFWTCRRVSEVTSLTWGSIEACTYPGGRAGFRYAYRQKGHSREPATAELPAPAMSAIVTYLEESGRISSMQPDSPVFTSVGRWPGRVTYTHPISAHAVERAMRAYVAKADLDPRITVHSIRHTAAVVRYGESRDVIEVMKALGHRSLSSSYIYLQSLTRNQQDEAALRLQARFADL